MSLDMDRMAALRQRFTAAAGEDAARIERLLAAGDLDGVRAIAHGLAGRAGMFGFADLGEIARRADEAGAAALADRARDLVTALRGLSQGD